MNWRIWVEVIVVLILSNVVTGVILWKLGQKNGAKWQKYRDETSENMEKNVPYGDRFRADLGLDPKDWQPFVVHRRRKINGQWTED